MNFTRIILNKQSTIPLSIFLDNLLETRVCIPVSIHVNISQRPSVLSLPTHHQYLVIPDDRSVNPCHVADTTLDLFWNSTSCKPIKERHIIGYDSY
jgi:hypothetical protein